MVWLVSFFCLGILSASLIRGSFILYYMFAGLFLSCAFISYKNKNTFDWLFLFLVFLFGAAFLSNTHIISRRHISGYVSFKEKNICAVEGIIVSPPSVKGSRVSFIFKAQKIQTRDYARACCGNILVHIQGKQGFSYAERLILRGRLLRPFGFGGGKKNNYRRYLYRQGIYAVMYVSPRLAVRRMGKGEINPLKGLAFWFKGRIESVLSRRLSSISAGIVDAMLLGEKDNVPASVTNAMMKSGTVHILVVSGFNVGIVLSLIVLSLRLIRMSRPVRFHVSVFLLIIYAIMTGASNPVLRSSVMAVFFMCGYFLKRETDVYNSCALAGFCILAVNPQQLFDVGFQLSFASVISIVYLYPRLKAFFRIEFIRVRPVRFIAEGFLVSLSAWLGTMAFILYYFRMFSPITVFANILIVPLASLITLCGFSLVVTNFTLPFLTPALASVCELAVMVLIQTNACLIRMPGASFYFPLKQ